MSRSALSSRDRMLAALSCEEPDYAPCCFMVWWALERACRDDWEFFEKQLELGVDVRVGLPDVPWHFDPGVSVRTWVDRPEGERYPLLHKEYRTPSGTLTTAVRKTEDWPYGDEVPLFDDYLAGRSTQYLVSGAADLSALRHLFPAPSSRDILAFREMAAEHNGYAQSKGLLLSGGWRNWRSRPESEVGHEGGSMVGTDALMWLCGGSQPLYWAHDAPGLLEEIIALVAQWDLFQAELYLEAGAELIIERGWYAGTEFWSPRHFRQFMVPMLREKIALTHEAGAKFGYILTAGSMPLLDDLLELGIDVLIGVDPVQDKWMDLTSLVRRTRGRMCLWGGVCSPLTVERGSREEVWQAVEAAITACAPGGGFILSPVENVIDPSERTWRNVRELIRAWKHFRQA